MNVKHFIFPECECNKEGADVCDQLTGVCTCKPGWIGEKCEGKLKQKYVYIRLQMQLSWIHNYSFNQIMNVIRKIVCRDMSTIKQGVLVHTCKPHCKYLSHNPNDF